MALIELAKRFPRSRFHGYEISEQMLTLAEANRAEANLRNLAFHHVAREPLPADGSIDLALTFDCLHDMPHPEHAATAIRAALRADGTWFIADPIGEGSFEANLARKRYAALSYALSVLSCLPSALSERGGSGLGTLGAAGAHAARVGRGGGVPPLSPPRPAAPLQRLLRGAAVGFCQISGGGGARAHRRPTPLMALRFRYVKAATTSSSKRR